MENGLSLMGGWMRASGALVCGVCGGVPEEGGPAALVG